MAFTMIIDLLIIACGVYVIYWAVQMVQTKTIPEMLVGKGFPTSRAKDREGFIKATFPMTLVLGIVLFAVGVSGALGVFASYPLVDTLLSVVLIVVIVLYGVFLLKAQQKYLIGLEQKKKEKQEKKDDKSGNFKTY